MSKAIFLDRDGTLIVDKHYLKDPADVELIPGAADALARARSLGYQLYLFTNQSGIGRGLHTLEDTLRCNARMEELLALPKPLFDGICIAPESPEQPSAYRKPSPRFIVETIGKKNLNATHCWMVGDKESDYKAGMLANIHAAVVCTGKNTAADWAVMAPKRVKVFPSIVEFAASLT